MVVSLAIGSGGSQDHDIGDFTEAARKCLHPAAGTAKVWGIDQRRAVPETVITLTIFGVLISEMAIWECGL